MMWLLFCVFADVTCLPLCLQLCMDVSLDGNYLLTSSKGFNSVGCEARVALFVVLLAAVYIQFQRLGLLIHVAVMGSAHHDRGVSIQWT